MRRAWKELQKEGRKHSKDREQHIHKGSEHDTHIEQQQQQKASEKGVGRWAGGQGQPTPSLVRP